MAKSKPNSAQSGQTITPIKITLIESLKGSEAEKMLLEEAKKRCRPGQKVEIEYTNISVSVPPSMNEETSYFSNEPIGSIGSSNIQQHSEGREELYKSMEDFEEITNYKIDENLTKIRKENLESIISKEKADFAIRKAIETFSGTASKDFEDIPDNPSYFEHDNSKRERWVKTLESTYPDSFELRDTIKIILNSIEDADALKEMETFINKQNQKDSVKNSFINMVENYTSLITNEGSIASESHMLFQKKKESLEKHEEETNVIKNPKTFWSRFQVALSILKGKDLSNVCQRYAESIKSYEFSMNLKDKKILFER